MVEVFKTDVNNYQHAFMLINRIHRTFSQYKANFDLDDCDNILRVKSLKGVIQPSVLIGLLNDYGFHAEVLEDECAPVPSALDNYTSSFFRSSFN